MKKKNKVKSFWKITLIKPGGYDKEIDRIPSTHITVSSLISLMKAILAKHYLTHDEMIRSHLKRNTKQFFQPFTEQYTGGSSKDEPFTIWFALGSSGVQPRSVSADRET